MQHSGGKSAIEKMFLVKRIQLKYLFFENAINNKINRFLFIPEQKEFSYLKVKKRLNDVLEELNIPYENLKIDTWKITDTWIICDKLVIKVTATGKNKIIKFIAHASFNKGKESFFYIGKFVNDNFD